MKYDIKSHVISMIQGKLEIRSINEVHIVKCHRLGKQTGDSKIRRILVKFCNVELKTDVYRKIIALKNGIRKL